MLINREKISVVVIVLFLLLFSLLLLLSNLLLRLCSPAMSLGFTNLDEICAYVIASFKIQPLR